MADTDNPGDGHASASQGRLTPRQFQVARLVACCQSNAEIALALGVTTCTVRMHLRSIRRRLGAQCRQDLALYMVAWGYVDCREVRDILGPRLARVAEANKEL